MNRQELEKTASIQKITDAFITCLEEYSFHKVTVTRIIDTAGVNRTTFYKYFPDKYALKESFLKHVLDDFYNNTDYCFIKAKKDRIRDEIYSRNFEAVLGFFESNRRAYRVLWQSDMDPDLFGKMIRIHKEYILHTMETDELFSEEIRPAGELYAGLFAYNCMMTVRWWIEHYETISKEEVSGIMRANMENGFFQTYRSIVEEN